LSAVTLVVGVTDGRRGDGADVGRDDARDDESPTGDSRPTLTLRSYDPRDAAAVRTLHEWALSDAGTDPADVPGTDDLRRIESAYLDAGGAFLVGVVPAASTATDRPPATFDGLLVAMGGIVPTDSGRADERSVADAAELHRMRVAPTHQRRGYGRRLLAKLEERAAALGRDPVLATTAKRQSGAVALYRGAGYEAVGESREAGYDLVHFEKRLDAE
jgi:ribosomal protein S18 acetylase RimI-like enzyme